VESQEELLVDGQVVTPFLAFLYPSPSPNQFGLLGQMSEPLASTAAKTVVQPMSAHDAGTYQGADNRLLFIGYFLSISYVVPKQRSGPEGRLIRF
jgi:hypothetical protein